MRRLTLTLAAVAATLVTIAAPGAGAQAAPTRPAPAQAGTGGQAAPVPAAMPAGAPVAHQTAPTRLDARATTVRSDDGKVLPATTYRLSDGSTETVVDRAALKNLVATMAAIYPPCGFACDGKDPASYWVPAPPGYEYQCGSDAITAVYRSGYAVAELRYSPRCRTAWTRGCCYTNYAGFGYYSNGNYRDAVYAYGRNIGGRNIYSAMLNDANLLYQACFDNQIGGSPEWVCTGLF